jgi:hypothetical protein
VQAKFQSRKPAPLFSRCSVSKFGTRDRSKTDNILPDRSGKCWRAPSCGRVSRDLCVVCFRVLIRCDVCRLRHSGIACSVCRFVCGWQWMDRNILLSFSVYVWSNSTLRTPRRSCTMSSMRATSSSTSCLRLWATPTRRGRAPSARGECCVLCVCVCLNTTSCSHSLCFVITFSLAHTHTQHRLHHPAHGLAM